MKKTAQELAPGDKVDDLIVEGTMPLVKRHTFRAPERFISVVGIYIVDTPDGGFRFDRTSVTVPYGTVLTTSDD